MLNFAEVFVALLQWAAFKESQSFGGANMTDMRRAMETIQRIYQMLEDDESREIYMNRLAYNISGEDKYVLPLINTVFQHRGPRGYNRANYWGIDEALEKVPQNHEFLLYGAGLDGKHLLSLVKRRAGFAGFCSSTTVKQKNGYLGYPVMSPEELMSRRDLYVVIATSDARDELFGILENGNYPSKLIVDGPAYYSREFGEAEQYFGPEFIKFNDEETFVDAGCYDFRSSLALGRHCKCVKKVYAFEPDPENYKRCIQKADNRSRNRIRDVQILPYGAWSEKTTLHFRALGTVGSSFGADASAGISVPVTTIDSTIDPCNRVTMIKMDIEGSELEALKGARETILRDKPKLAICIYHKPEDLWEIPLYIKELVPEYRFYLRHHDAGGLSETVLYALMPESINADR